MTTETQTAESGPPRSRLEPTGRVALLTGGSDRHYTHGLALALAAAAEVEIIGGDAADGPEFHTTPGIRFLNLRGDQAAHAGRLRKVWRVLAYYARLLSYAARARPKIFHIIWNNKFEAFDRTLLMLYYRALGKRVFLTVHNVNIAARDGGDSFWNRLTLRIQYRLAEGLFVHTAAMANELRRDFAVPAGRITVVPLGANTAMPNTALTPAAARERLGLAPGDRVLLAFGLIRPYKGLEYLVRALAVLARGDSRYKLVIAGRPRFGDEDYWELVQREIGAAGLADRVAQHIEFVGEGEAEVFFKAADAMVLPYTHIYDSGVLWTGFSFGLPAIATDVGSMAEAIREGENGCLCPPRDPAALAAAIERYFASPLYADLGRARLAIAAEAKRTHSWTAVARIAAAAYGILQAPR